MVEAVKRETGLPVSVDTYKYETARLALEAGADILLGVSDIPGVVSYLGEAVELGWLSEERIDESVLRVLSLKSEYLGEF